MCGLVGMVRFDGGDAEPAVLEAMGAELAHRGPDGDGFFAQGPVGFHHKRLAILDLASGQQPMTFDGITVVLNGEIYNYLELREELRSAGHRFRTASDTEVLLRLYLEHGDALVEHLNGMFAFLLFDSARNRILAVRDHFGIKPLYFHADERRIVYGSEIKALLRCPGVPAVPDRDGVRDYLTFQFVLGERTMFAGISKLLPGHMQVVDVAAGRIEQRCWWEPRFTVDAYHTEQYFVDEVRRLLEDAVRLQMRSDVPVGSYLSGGLDSSLVTALAAREGGSAGRFASFAGAFDEGPEFDERPHARLMADACGATLHEVVPTAAEFRDLLPRLVWQMDEPAAGPGLFPQHIVSRLAARHVKVCLGGQGGDEIFGGYARYLVAYLEQALKGAIQGTNEEAEHIVSLRSIVPHLSSLRSYVPMLQDFWRDDLFAPMDRRYFRLVDRSGGALALAAPEFRLDFEPEAVFARFQGVFNHPDTLSYYNKMTHFDLVTGLPALLHVEDRASMAASLESRVPLLDRRIVELVTSMPPRMKFRGGELKYILKKAVADLLPSRILDRPEKMGFPVPLHAWLAGPLRDFVGDILASRACRERGILDPVAMDRAVRDERAFGRRVWGLLNLELWHTTFIDGAA